MITKGALTIGLTGLMLSACIKHEVIPPPIPMVDLEADFIGNIQGTDVEYTQHVLGYDNQSSKAKIILPPPSLSSAVYYAEMGSSQLIPSIKISLGSVLWDSGSSLDPTLSLFNNFFLVNDSPPYSNGGVNGFAVTYTDQTGRNWTSSESSLNAQDVQFTGIVQESDSTGDYSKFVCNFNCYLYSLHPDSLALSPPVNHMDSIQIQDAIYTGWFKR